MDCARSKTGHYTSRDGSNTRILKVAYPCNNSPRIASLIHGFSPVNARLFITRDTAFYAIISVVTDDLL